jgi:DNA-binding CsgD family transcriptional regulator
VWCASIRGLIHAKQGDWKGADERLGEAEHALARLGHDPMCRLGITWVRAERLLGSGAFEAALGELERILPEVDVLGDLLVSTRTRITLARTRLALDDAGRALGALMPAVRGWTEASERSLPTAPSLLLAAIEAASAAGDTALAQRHARELEARAAGPRAEFGRALAATAAGRPGPPGAAESAAAATDELGWHFDATRMRLLAAEALGRAGRSEEAIGLATGALESFREMASEGWCGRAEGVLRGLGRRPPARPKRRSGTLSARELEVLQLLATGATNRAIARRLFISEKTAGHHVESIFAKLDVHSRAQAVSVAAQRGLVEHQAP